MNLLVPVSLGLNMVLTSVVVWTYINVPFDVDLIRYNYMQDMKWVYSRACVAGTDYPPEYRLESPGYNENSPMEWCNRLNREMADLYLEGAMKLTKRKP